MCLAGQSVLKMLHATPFTAPCRKRVIYPKMKVFIVAFSIRHAHWLPLIATIHAVAALGLAARAARNEVSP